MYVYTMCASVRLFAYFVRLFVYCVCVYVCVCVFAFVLLPPEVIFLPFHVIVTCRR
jgi:hypothetical protein